MVTTAATAPINLNAPLKWTDASPLQLQMLRALQGNILKGHGRHFTANIFIQFGADTRVSRRLIRDIANHHVTDAHAQLLAAKQFKHNSKPGGDFCHVALSFTGYTALGEGDNAPADPDFRSGMRDTASLRALGDPDLSDWEDAFRKPLDAMVLAAAETEGTCARLTGKLIALIEGAGATVVHIQRGKQLISAAGEGIEHFGYVDGRSQPLMLVEDIDAEAGATGTARWDPQFPLSTALVVDVGVTAAPDNQYSFGSYFIFRKLEQHVRRFKKREQEIADILKLKGDDRELAGAMIVGRFEDGTPVTMSNTARTAQPPFDQVPPNDFNYDGDEGARCPFHGHIRKTNPRGSGGKESETDERKHLMARRGITYEDVKRVVHPDELPEADDSAAFDLHVAPHLPDGGVGLLFMAYNNDIGNQFKFTQRFWANANNFPGGKANTNNGMDPVIGQATTPGDQRMPTVWDDTSKPDDLTCAFSGHVQMKGGEYFFSPSLPYLKGL